MVDASAWLNHVVSLDRYEADGRRDGGPSNDCGTPSLVRSRSAQPAHLAIAQSRADRQGPKSLGTVSLSHDSPAPGPIALPGAQVVAQA